MGLFHKMLLGFRVRRGTVGYKPRMRKTVP
jgi:hypothetical protein